MGARRVAFSGGEPLLWPDLGQAVALCRRLGMHTTVYTSGTSDGATAALQQLQGQGLDRAIFSLFGASCDIHESVTTVSGSFELTLSAIRRALDVGLMTELHFVPMQLNYRQLPALVGFVADLGITQVSVLRLVPQGRGQLIFGQQLTPAQNRHLRRMIIDLRDAGFNVRTGSPYNFLMVNAEPGCFSGIDRLIIAPDGRIYPCDAFKQIRAEEIAGTDAYSVVGPNDLQSCWRDSPYLGAIRAYLTSDFADPCRICPSLDKCLSGCLAQKVLATGSLVKVPDPACLSNTGL
jgi:radical SAM protein with 4Fe4S-binding SPASM domain